jgi:glycosyltransferase involved in cell wall biosynthesis
MKISIVTPCFNANSFIRETVLSVISQKGDFSIEYLVVDGGSSDGTDRTLAEIKSELNCNTFKHNCNDISFEYYSEPDGGMYDALSKAFTQVSGDIIAYINASDFYLPGAFSAVTSAFLSHPEINWLTGWNTWAKENGVIYNNLLPFAYHRRLIQSYQYNGTTFPHIQQESTFWRAELLNNINLHTLSSYKYAGDYYLWSEFSCHDDLYIAHAQLGCFRVHIGQQSESLEHYHNEAKVIKRRTRSPYDFFLLAGHWLLWRAPNAIKRKLSKYILSP